MGALGGKKEEREWGEFVKWSGRKGRYDFGNETKMEEIGCEIREIGKCRRNTKERGSEIDGKEMCGVTRKRGWE